VEAAWSTEYDTDCAYSQVSRLTLMCESFWIREGRNVEIALSDECEGEKGKAIINMPASRFDCHINVRNHNTERNVLYTRYLPRETRQSP
jgi:hypothetical protein